MVQPRHTSEAGFQNVRCRGQGCGAVGKAMLEGYCNKCYVKEQSTRLNEAASRGSTSPPVLVSCSVSHHCLLRELTYWCIYLVGFVCLLIYSLIFCHQRAPKSRPMATLSQAQCRRSGCKNVSPGCTDLCPDCLNRGGQREGRRAHAPKEKSKQRCRTQGCDHYANQEKQGYCNECDHFKQIYRGWCYHVPFFF